VEVEPLPHLPVAADEHVPAILVPLEDRDFDLGLVAEFRDAAIGGVMLRIKPDVIH
jgi:hypothetical protein